jgi:hypothetical protein
MINRFQVLLSNSTCAAITWNLCSSTHLVDDVAICWYADDQKFTAAVEVVTDALDLPDGTWDLTIYAPLGGVRGEVLDKGSSAGA